MYSSNSSRAKYQKDECVDDVLQNFDRIVLEQAQFERRKFVAFEKKKGLESRISELTNEIEQTSKLLEVTLAHVQDEENALKEAQSTYKSLRRAIQNKMELNKLKQQQDAVKKFHADSLRSQIQARLSACIRTEEKIQKTIRKKRPELAVLKEQDRRVSMIWEVVFAKNKQKCVPEVQDVIELAVEYAAAQKKNKMRPEEQDCSIQYPIRNKETLTSAVIPGKSSKYKQKDKEDNIFTLTPYSAYKSSRTTKSLNFQNSLETRTAYKDSSLKENPDLIERPNRMHKLELFQHSRQSESTYLGAPPLHESLKENVNKARLPTRVIELEMPHRAVGYLPLSQSIRTVSFTESHKEKLKSGLSSTPQAIQNKIEPLKDRSFSQCDQTTNSKLQSPVLPRPVILATPDTVEGSTNVLKKYDLQFTANLTPQNRSTNVEPVPEMIAKSDPSPISRKRENKEKEMPKEKKIRILPVKQSGSLNEGSHLLKMWLQKKNEISAATSEVPKENATPEKRERRSVEEEEKQPSDDCNKSLNQQEGYEICRSPASPHELMEKAVAVEVVGASGCGNGDDSASIADSGVEPDCRSVCTTPYTPRYQFQLWTPKGKRASDSCLDAQTTPKILKDIDGNPVKAIDFLKIPDEDDFDAETPIAKPSQSSTPSQTPTKKEKVISVSVLRSHFNEVSPIAHRSGTFTNSLWNNCKRPALTDLPRPAASNQSPGQVLTPRKTVSMKPTCQLSQYVKSNELNNPTIDKSCDDEMGEGEEIVKANVDEIMSKDTPLIKEHESSIANLKDATLSSGISAPKKKANAESPAPIDLAKKADLDNHREYSLQNISREAVLNEDTLTNVQLQNIQSSMDYQKRKEVVAPNFVESPSKIHLTPLFEVKRPCLSEAFENPEAHIEKQEESLKSSHDISNAEAKGFNSSIQPDKASDFVFDFAEKANPIQFAQDFFFGAVPGTETAATEGMVFSFAFASEDSSMKANETDPFSFFND
ncbi:uncharacterized protein LOC136030187 isoform X2 [Artemia franciscana]|uniref:uncharacterized protein LOC136030187 isoform X2 n=1 Tax=Artemia franciscana TaxID=6661 RepID=UPI0032DABDB7